jgi:hypothetical protein
MKYPERSCHAKHCDTCCRETPHQLRSCGGAGVWICEMCVERALSQLAAMEKETALQPSSA